MTGTPLHSRARVVPMTSKPILVERAMFGMIEWYCDPPAPGTAFQSVAEDSVHWSPCPYAWALAGNHRRIFAVETDPSEFFANGVTEAREAGVRLVVVPEYPL